MSEKQAWYEVWFDSPYYHLLYNNRNINEAENFIENLLKHLDLKPKSTVLDLACGKGRHAQKIAQYDTSVVGVDLSPESIKAANEEYQQDNLEFYIHDMRDPLRINYFDYVFNFFTSFGYFDDTNDNNKVVQSIDKNLKKNGTVVIDFMNAEKAINDLNEREEILRDEIKFNIRREVVNNQIKKHIKFDAEGKVFSFTESVQALKPYHFHKLMSENNFTIQAEFGDYELNEFQSNVSSRYILVATKN